MYNYVYIIINYIQDNNIETPATISANEHINNRQQYSSDYVGLPLLASTIITARGSIFRRTASQFYLIWKFIIQLYI